MLISFIIVMYVGPSAIWGSRVGWLKPWLMFSVSSGGCTAPLRPRLVVTRMTPLAARDPYMAAVASFRTLMLSMSRASSRSRPPSRSGTPSITTSALLSFSVWLPRMRMIAPSYPGSPLGLTVTRPGSWPLSVFDRLFAGMLCTSLPDTALTAPVNVPLACSPYPIATTGFSSNGLGCSRRLTSVGSPCCTTTVVSAGA